MGTDYCPHCGSQVSSDYLRRWEAGEVDLEAECNQAADTMEQFYRARPEMAPLAWQEAHRTPRSFGDAVMKVFGNG